MPPIDRRLSQAISRAIDQAGIRPSQRAHRVSDYRLERLLGETAAYQDGKQPTSGSLRLHAVYVSTRRRHSQQNSAAVRDVRRQSEFRLEGINHAGILKALDLHEHERGPALIFEHDPEAQRLDWFLRDRGETPISIHALAWCDRLPKRCNMPMSTACTTVHSVPRRSW